MVKAIVVNPVLGVEALAGELAVLRLRAHHPDQQKREEDSFHGAA